MATRKRAQMSQLVAALETAWSGPIRRKYPEIPYDVIITVASGGKQAKMKYAHFWANRWVAGNAKSGPSRAKNPVQYHEVVIVGEHLYRKPEDVFGTLLHEAVHARAHAKGIRDTSRDGRYHNKQFATLAEDMGLTVTTNASLGYAHTAILPETAKRYTAAIAKIAAAQRMFRSMDHQAERKAKDRNYVKAECDCEPARIIRVSTATIEEGGLGCAFCDGEFHAAG